MNLKILLTAAALAAPAIASATITVDGDADIFAAGLSSPPALPNGGGSLPPWIAVTGGETLTITATGLVNCCDTSGTPGPSGPGGFVGNPFGGSSSIITDDAGSGVATFSDLTGSFPLVGVFNTGSETPFVIGGSDTVVVPVGATRLYFGLADAAGFNGPAGFYNDNSGAFSVAVATPEPATWAIMLFGLFGAGALLRRRRATLAIGA